MNFELAHEGSRTTSSLLRHLLNILPHPMGSRVSHGLPAGSIALENAGLILGGTPCTEPLFHAAMVRAAAASKFDVLIARHGMHPEVLDPVLFDALIWSGDRLVMLIDHVLYAGHDGHRLVPSHAGAYVRMAANGLHIEAEPGFKTWQERCDGVCRAARDIIRVTRGTEVL